MDEIEFTKDTLRDLGWKLLTLARETDAKTVAKIKNGKLKAEFDSDYEAAVYPLAQK